jgi:hypothetical protein
VPTFCQFLQTDGQQQVSISGGRATQPARTQLQHGSVVANTT